MSKSTSFLNLPQDLGVCLAAVGANIPAPPELAFAKLDRSYTYPDPHPRHRWQCSRFTLDQLEIDGRSELNGAIPKFLRLRFPGIDAASIQRLRDTSSAVIEHIAPKLGHSRVCVLDESNRSSSPKQLAADLCAHMGALVQEHESTTDLHCQLERQVALRTWLSSVIISVVTVLASDIERPGVFGAGEAQQKLQRLNDNKPALTKSDGLETQRGQVSYQPKTKSLVKIIQRYTPVRGNYIPSRFNPTPLDPDGTLFASTPRDPSMPPAQSHVNSPISSSLLALDSGETGGFAHLSTKSRQPADGPFFGQSSRTTPACLPSRMSENTTPSTSRGTKTPVSVGDIGGRPLSLSSPLSPAALAALVCPPVAVASVLPIAANSPAAPPKRTASRPKASPYPPRRFCNLPPGYPKLIIEVSDASDSEHQLTTLPSSEAGLIAAKDEMYRLVYQEMEARHPRKRAARARAMGKPEASS